MDLSCPDCSRPIETKDKFCPWCGFELRSESDPPSGVGQTERVDADTQVIQDVGPQLADCQNPETQIDSGAGLGPVDWQNPETQIDSGAGLGPADWQEPDTQIDSGAGLGQADWQNPETQIDSGTEPDPAAWQEPDTQIDLSPDFGPAGRYDLPSQIDSGAGPGITEQVDPFTEREPRFRDRPTELAGQLMPGYVLKERYQIEGLLGRGGMGAVYKAADLRLIGKYWAVKEMTEAGLYPAEREAAVMKFKGEAYLLAQLQHQNLPEVADFFEDGDSGRHYLVMDFIQGDTLEDLLKQQEAPFSEALVCDWAFQLCDVLGYLHGQIEPIVFRDLKPSNIMLESTGRVKLIDFGIARVFKGDRDSDTELYGTIGYSSPEQFGHKETDKRSDIYSLGVTLLRLSTGHDPAVDPFKLPAARQVNPAVSRKLESVIKKAIRKERADRFSSVQEVHNALIRTRAPINWLRVGLVFAAVAIFASISVILFVLFGDGKSTPAPTEQVVETTLEDIPSSTPSGELTGGSDPFGSDATKIASPTKATPSSTPSVVPSTTPTDTPESAPELKSFIVGNDDLTMRLVPAGYFIMGSTSSQTSAAATECRRHADRDSCLLEDFNNEMPQREVYISAFYMDETEITNAQYKACVNDGSCSLPDSGSGSYRRSNYYDRSQYANYPVVWVSWYDARVYCQWTGERLPTEAEWEKAARGTDGTIYPWGNTFSTSKANTQDRGREAIDAAGQFPSGTSPFGLYDMAGNVWEYVSDWFDPDYYGIASDRNPQGPSSSPSGKKVLRSGSFANYNHYARTANRGSVTPGSKTQFRGIRCVIDAE